MYGAASGARSAYGEAFASGPCSVFTSSSGTFHGGVGGVRARVPPQPRPPRGAAFVRLKDFVGKLQGLVEAARRQSHALAFGATAAKRPSPMKATGAAGNAEGAGSSHSTTHRLFPAPERTQNILAQPVNPSS